MDSMLVSQPTRQYPHLGSSLSLWPLVVDGELNVVSHERRIAHEIIDLMLTHKGDDPTHCGDRTDPRNNYGISVDLFSPTTDLKVPYFCYQLRREILRWIDLEQVLVSAEVVTDPTLFVGDWSESAIASTLKVTVTFIPREYPVKNQLTFPWVTYSGVSLDQSPNILFDDIALNGDRFIPF